MDGWMDEWMYGKMYGKIFWRVAQGSCREKWPKLRENMVHKEKGGASVLTHRSHSSVQDTAFFEIMSAVRLRL